MRLRAGALAAVVAAALLVLALMLRGPSYEVSLTLANASQLVTGDQVKVGGVPVGKVSSIGLSGDGQAHLKLSIRDGDLTPLHSGTKAIIRSTSLAGIANRYVALQPGPNNAAPIPDGGAIPAEDGRPEVDLDAVLNTLGPGAQRDLRALVRASSGLITPQAEKQANQGLHALNPALSQSAATAREIIRDQPAFERFILESADVVSTVTSRPEDLDQTVDNAAGALSALADRSEALDRTLVKLPDTLRSANTTLVNLRATLADLRPALRDAAPAAPVLSAFLARLSPFVHTALPIVARVRRTVDRPGSVDLLGVVRGFPSVEAAATPAFKSAHGTLTDALPVLADVRPYTPDVLGGLVNGFGGTTAGYYDANGHYARIAFEGGPYSATNAGSAVPVPSSSKDSLAGYRKGVTNRCPGAAAQPAGDKSNPFVPEGHPCKAEDSSR